MWIESHQTLRGHPKVRRAARLLSVPPAQVIGHLHLLWWWVLDHAFDGDVSAYDAMDLADAAEWEDDPDTFVKALIECGPGGTSGFIDADGPHLHVHDWAVYTEHLRIRRAAAMKANHDRWHVKRGVAEPSCALCHPVAIPSESDRTPMGSDPESTQPNQTAPHRTEPAPTHPRPAVAARWPDGWTEEHPRSAAYVSILKRLKARLGADWDVLAAEKPEHVQKLRNACGRAAEAEVDAYRLADIVTTKPLNGLSSYAAGLATRIDDALLSLHKQAPATPAEATR